MVDKVNSALEKAFPGIDLDLELLSNGRITGTAVWDGFIGLDQVDRQTKIRSALRAALGSDAAIAGVIFTYTADELRAMKAA
ncbi:MAG: hypothetical protein P4L33_19165 [Capsulimonadaceae bacterium]|nr:hypothetical protein [Capsulimonadaceae bacterium]